MASNRTNRISRFKARIVLEVDNAGEIVVEFAGPGPGENGVEGLGDTLKRHADRLAEKIWAMESGAIEKAQGRITELEEELKELQSRLENTAKVVTAPVSRPRGRPPKSRVAQQGDAAQ